MQLVFKKIALVAETNTAVLVMGESGTGKELVAEAIHRNSPRRNGPFVPIHLAALNEQVIESELFGHVQGSFTGADRDRSGLFEQAQGGTLFLDEIGDVPLGVQVKILRAIERKEFTPVGDPRPRSCDFRLVAATHRPLSQMVAQGKFRADLFFRLTAFQIEMPPLRDRLDDLPALTSHLLARIRGKESSGILSTEFLDELRHRPWIGNVRELLQALESAAIMARDGELQPEHLPTPLISVASYSETPEERATLEQNLERWVQSQLNQEGGMELRSLHSDLLEKIEPILFREVLAACHGHRGKAADLLGIHRGTLRDKLRQYQIAGED